MNKRQYIILGHQLRSSTSQPFMLNSWRSCDPSDDVYLPPCCLSANKIQTQTLFYSTSIYFVLLMKWIKCLCFLCADQVPIASRCPTRTAACARCLSGKIWIALETLWWILSEGEETETHWRCSGRSQLRANPEYLVHIKMYNFFLFLDSKHIYFGIYYLFIYIKMKKIK